MLKKACLPDGAVKHILLPAIAPATVIGLYFTPLELIGCANRGLAALGVVLVSLVAGIAVGMIGIKARRNDPASRWWWVATMALLAAPALLVLGPLR
ncbi:MAG: hypothetical protein ACYC9M_12060 [Desulfobulbaceae bacterium]